MKKESNNVLDYPKKFFWGASISAYQVEGNNHNQWTVWELENAKVRAAQSEYQLANYSNWGQIKLEARDPRNYVSGVLADHYNKYLDDFDLLEKMNMNAFRFSVEWSRIEPKEGAWNVAAIKHYKEYVDELSRRGIEPIMTLFHFTLPVWFVEKGGFEKRSNVKYFTRFAKKIVSELGRRVKFIITINEPEIYTIEGYHLGNWPPALDNNFKCWRVANNLAFAHIQASKSIHKLSRRYKVSISKNSKYYRSDGALLSRLSAFIMQYIQDDYFIKKVVKYCDFIGVNYYFSSNVHGSKAHDSEDHVSDIGWGMQPSDIQCVLERLHNKYNLPIIITENGLADVNDDNRRWWISKTLIGIHKAMKNGVKVQGYLHWSLIDNFEWAYGKWPRFGLASVDYKTGERKLRPSAIWYGRIIKKIREL
ncbi:MAG: beta-glucosidase [Patescibacteria group bacterium]|nr:beta-glucosidase [Patescibacteria group bacterium]